MECTGGICLMILSTDVTDSTNKQIQKRQDHKLKGSWQDFRECHIEPDWLLIYAIVDFELRPTRLGTHSELFT